MKALTKNLAKLERRSLSVVVLLNTLFVFSLYFILSKLADYIQISNVAGDS